MSFILTSAVLLIPQHNNHLKIRQSIIKLSVHLVSQLADQLGIKSGISQFRQPVSYAADWRSSTTILSELSVH
jgi:hypothetical protein